MEFIVEKIGMSRTIEVPSVPVTLLKVVETKVCEVREDGKALVAYNSGKKINRSIEGQQKKFSISKEFNKFIKSKGINYQTKEVEEGALVITRVSQKAIKNWQRPKKLKTKE